MNKNIQTIKKHNMAQQTAMQALWEWIDANYHEESFNLNDARDMSLKLEKEQISKAYRQSVEEDVCSVSFLLRVMNNPLRTGEEYYKETYESK
jgi:hypothetical protein